MKFACVGDNCIDYYQNIDSTYCGGNPVNVGVYAVRNGDEASYIGVVGTDPNGQLMLKSLTEHGLDISHVKVLPGNTAKTTINLIKGERVFCGYQEGVLSDFRLSEEDIDFIATHDIMVTGRWGKVHTKLAEIKKKQILIAFDFATKLGDEIYEDEIKYVDYAFFSAEEENEEVRENLETMTKMGVKIAVCTLGKNGSIAYDGISFKHFGIIPCKVKDTMGAGDSYIAGFLHGITRLFPTQICMQMGAECSSVTLQHFGAW